MSSPGEARWLDLGRMLWDCRALLVVSAGSVHRKILRGKGLRIVEMEA
jgi:hypothetical protein